MKTRFCHLLCTAFVCLTLYGSLNAQILVTNNFENRSGLETFFMKDFDITRPSSGPPIFSILLTNQYPATANGLVMTLEVSSTIYGLIASGTTDPFSLPTGQQSVTSNQIFTNVGDFGLANFNYEETLIDKLLSDILATGKLPTDIYTFNITIADPNNTPVNTQFNITVTNPQKVDLVYPGMPVTERYSDCPPVFTNLPLMQIESDMTVLQVIVAEAKEGEDAESSLNQEPRFVQNYYINAGQAVQIIPQFPELEGDVKVLSSTTFQYPASGHSLPLVPGKTYVWQTIGFIQSSSGLAPLESEIYCFHVPKIEQINSNQLPVEMILRNLLGSDFEKIFGESGELKNHEMMRVKYKGREVTVAELLALLPELKQTFNSYRIE